MRLRAVFLCLFLSVSFYARAASYVDLEPALIINYLDGKKLRYLKVEVTLEASADEFSVTEINYHADYLRHELIMLLSSQDAELFESMEGKEQVRTSALQALQAIMLQETGKSMIDKVLFTSFVTQ